MLNYYNYTRKNTEQFWSDLNNANFDIDNCFFSSYEVVSLFTNVPLDETTDIYFKRLYDDNIVDLPKINF